MRSSPIRVLSIMEAAFVTGPAKNLLSFAQLARPDVEFTTATYERGRDESGADRNPYVQAAKQRGISVRLLVERGRFDRALLVQLQTLMADLRPDIVQTHNVKSHFLMRYTGLFRQYRWLAFHHGYTTTDFKMRLYNQLDRWSLQKAAHLVTVCGPFREQLRQQGIAPERITVRHNAIPPFDAPAQEEVESLRRKLGVPPGRAVLLMVSRLSHEKGHLDFLAALPKLPRNTPEWHAVIVGEGPERGAIEAVLTANPALKSSVTLAGHQNDVRPFLAMADVFVMPSHSEGSPNALLEAMAAGIPVVASAVGGIPEIATNGDTALLVPSHDPQALAGALHSTLAERASAHHRAVRARQVTDSFTADSYREAMLALYARLLRQPPGSIV